MRQIAGKGEFLCRAVRAERFDENEEGSYNRHRKVLPVDGQPRQMNEKPASCEGLGGLSYAFRTTRINSVTRSNASKSLIVIGIAPL